jgi:hypothetical protein
MAEYGQLQLQDIIWSLRSTVLANAGRRRTNSIKRNKLHVHPQAERTVKFFCYLEWQENLHPSSSRHSSYQASKKTQAKTKADMHIDRSINNQIKLINMYTLKIPTNQLATPSLPIPIPIIKQFYTIFE